jgi:riboflavin transporter FmnP
MDRAKLRAQVEDLLLTRHGCLGDMLVGFVFDLFFLWFIPLYWLFFIRYLKLDIIREPRLSSKMWLGLLAAIFVLLFSGFTRFLLSGLLELAAQRLR